jgi:hypothetical protein
MKTTKLEIWKDDDCEGFGAFLAGSSSDRPMIVLNVASTLLASKEHDINAKEFFIETLMHEFGHFLEEMFDKDFDEDFIEKCIQSYRDKYKEGK